MSATTQENNFKVVFDAFNSDPTGPGGRGSPTKTFTATLNPESIRREYEVQFNMDNSANNTSRYVKQYHGMGEEVLSLTLTFDGTGSLEDANTTDNPVKEVQDQLDEFKEVVYGYDGGIHKIRWLTITLGKEDTFDCHLKTLEIEITKATPLGEPQRAIINASFTHHTHSKNLTRTMNRSSPDMSHLIKVKDGDRLTLFCDNIYHDISYYTDVAKANNLTNFRNLKSGSNLIFPPLST